MARHDQQKLDDLKRVPLFSRCTKKELQRLANIADRIELPDGRVLCREGAGGRECFVIIDGSVLVSIAGRVVGTAGAGQAVGEMALLGRRRRVATAVADGPVSVYVIHGSQFDAVLADVPGIARSVLRTLSERFAEFELAAAS